MYYILYYYFLYCPFLSFWNYYFSLFFFYVLLFLSGICVCGVIYLCIYLTNIFEHLLCAQIQALGLYHE